ncbi:MAG: SdrD B-like domain-containing protein [Caldilineaceae bacterium]
MKVYFRRTLLTVFLALLLLAIAQIAQAADGTLPVQTQLEGNYCIAHGGTGLLAGGTQNFSVNVEGTPVQAYLYWSARYNGANNGDNQVNASFNGGAFTPITAAASESAYAGFNRGATQVFYYTYRSADIVGLLPGSGTINVAVNNLTTPEGHGVGLVVISQGPNCDYGRVQLNFGLDGFFWNFAPDAGPNTQVTCVDIPVATVARTLDLQMFVGGVEHDQLRGDRIWYAVGSGTPPTDIIAMADPNNVLDGPIPPSKAAPYPLNGSNGDWDDYTNSITVPAGATYACFQIESIAGRDPVNGTSGVWVELSTKLTYLPGIDVLKLTNGNDAKNANDADVPVIAPNAAVVWTYLVSNTGQVPFDASEVTVTDSVEGTITNRIADNVGNNDDTFEPGEIWTFQKSGTARTLSSESGSFIVDGCGNAETGGVVRNTYANGVTAQAGELTATDTSHYCNPLLPGIEVLKLTNGNDAKNANDADVPIIAPSAQVIWTYLVTNTGAVAFDASEVTVTDSVEGAVTDRIGDTVGNNDSSFEPGEVWTFQKSGTARTLSSESGSFIVDGCGNAATGGVVRNTYANGVTAQAGQLTATDTSHYCNPLLPGIEVLKLTNGNDAKNANDADVPVIAPSAQVIWTYLVTNTGAVAFDASEVTVTDSVEGAVTDRIGDTVGNNDSSFEPGEVWTFQKSGTARTLSSESGSFIVDGCGNAATGGVVRNTYANGVTAQAGQLTATDTSHYCNPLDTAAVGNRVWGDINPNGATPDDIAQGNGIQDNDPREQGIDGIIVELHAGSGELISTTTTSNGGQYLFSDLEPGDYFLVFINPLESGIFTNPNVGSDDEVDSGAATTVDDARGPAQRTETFTLEAGDIDLSWDAGLIGLSGTGSAAVGNFVWNDRNQNGLQDGGDETGVAAITVRLFNSNNQLVAETTTNDQGIYNFPGIDPGTYYVEFVLPNNFNISPLNVGNNDEIDSDVDPTTHRTESFTVPVFTTDLRWDAGLFQPTNLGEENEPLQIFLFLPMVAR